MTATLSDRVGLPLPEAGDRFSPAVQDLREQRLRVLGEGISAAHGAFCAVTYTHEFAPTVNDPRCAQAAAAAATSAVGADRTVADCEPFLGSEDFGVLAAAVPGCFTFLGNGNGNGNGTEPGRGGTPLHSRDYDLNDEVLDVGVRLCTELVRSEPAAR